MKYGWVTTNLTKARENVLVHAKRLRRTEKLYGCRSLCNRGNGELDDANMYIMTTSFECRLSESDKANFKKEENRGNLLLKCNMLFAYQSTCL